MKPHSYISKRPTQAKGGYSLVEVLVAITVLLVALVAPLTIAYSGLKRANVSKEQTQAIFLAQEGIEAVMRLRENSALSASGFDNLAAVWSTNMGTAASRCSSKCGVLISDAAPISASSFYACNSTNCSFRFYEGAAVPFKQGASGGTETAFVRELTLTPSQSPAINAFVRVRSEVRWGSGAAEKVVLESYVYNTYYEP